MVDLKEGYLIDLIFSLFNSDAYQKYCHMGKDYEGKKKILFCMYIGRAGLSTNWRDILYPQLLNWALDLPSKELGL